MGIIIDEAKSLIEVRKETLKKFVEVQDPGEKIRIRGDIEYIESSMRQLKIGEKALSYLSESKQRNDSLIY